MSQPEKAGRGAPSNRATLIAAVIAVLFVVVPFLFWHGTWFGRSLSEKEIGEYLADGEKPRKAQHALAQISERMAQGDPSVRQWYPEIVALAGHELPELRLTTAWLMGQDAQSEAFHRKLLDLLQDPEPLVRRNAALSLAAFRDDSGRAILTSMLRPLTVESPYEGIVTNRLKEGDAVDKQTLLARVAVAGEEEPREIRASVPGTVKEALVEDGASVRAGDAVMILDPNPEHVFQALRALFLVGAAEDLPDVERFTRPGAGKPPQVVQQAQLTAAELRSKAGR